MTATQPLGRLARFALAGMIGLLVLVTATPAAAQSADRVFEIRTYTATEGHLDDVVGRFREGTHVLLAEYGMEPIGYWTPQDPELRENTLIYILAHPSRDAARENWQAFFRDPRWIALREKSEANGPILEKVHSQFVDPTDFSPLR